MRCLNLKDWSLQSSQSGGVVMQARLGTNHRCTMPNPRKDFSSVTFAGSVKSLISSDVCQAAYSSSGRTSPVKILISLAINRHSEMPRARVARLKSVSTELTCSKCFRTVSEKPRISASRWSRVATSEMISVHSLSFGILLAHFAV